MVTAVISLPAAEAGGTKVKADKAAKPAKAAKATKEGKAAQRTKGTLYHVVSFKFKPTATAEQIQQIETAFAGLKDKIPAIKSLDWGTNVSPEKHDKGFTHCWILAFKTEADRDAYLVHPEHQAFGASVGPVVEDVFVVDFRARK